MISITLKTDTSVLEQEPWISMDESQVENKGRWPGSCHCPTVASLYSGHIRSNWVARAEAIRELNLSFASVDNAVKVVTEEKPIDTTHPSFGV